MGQYFPLVDVPHFMTFHVLGCNRTHSGKALMVTDEIGRKFSGPVLWTRMTDLLFFIFLLPPFMF